MTSVSKQVQDAVMEIVDLREQIMVDRFAYRDLIAQMVDLTEVAPSDTLVSQGLSNTAR
jgi:hypothetical protein